MMKSGKQRYYAALEHEENAGRLLGQRRREATLMDEPRGEDLLYADIGARAYKAFANILDSLGEMAARSGSARVASGSDEGARRVLEGVQEEFRALRHKLEQHDMMLHEIAAGIRRIDKFTLEAFQRMQAPERAADYRTEEPSPGRLSKEETTERALVAARELRDQGERLTLKAVSRRAGLRYAQVVYAFGRKEELINRLEQEALAAEEQQQKDADERTA